MKNETKKSSNMPLIIIGAVLVAAVLGGYFYYNSARTTGPKSAANTNTNASRAANAPLGATPPNMMGSPTASVTLEEFADFQCGACASVHPTLKEIASIYGGRIRFIFRHYPLAIPGHDKSYEAAAATEAAGLQDRAKFWAMQSLLLENQKDWTANPNYRSIWEGYAQQIGLDVERFKNDVAGREAKSRVDADIARGRGMSLDSTPTLLVNGRSIPLQQITTANLRQLIDAELQKAVSAPPANGSSAPAGSPAAPAGNAASPAANSAGTAANANTSN